MSSDLPDELQVPRPNHAELSLIPARAVWPLTVAIAGALAAMAGAGHAQSESSSNQNIVIRAARGDAPQAALMRSFKSLDYRKYEFDGGAYLGFPQSHDVWGDGSVVVVPAPGHTPGSVVVFLALPSGKRYALLGDLVWAMEGITLPAERPWLPRWLIGEDAAQVRENVTRLAAIHARYPEIELVPAHDMRALATLPHFPASGG
mgnify:CR=1 FL=1